MVNGGLKPFEVHVSTFQLWSWGQRKVDGIKKPASAEDELA
jgi:hypothetical protein